MRTLVGIGCTFIASVTLALGGCSSSSSPTAQPSPLGNIPSDKAASTLSASDATQACHSAIAYTASALMGPICMLDAIAFAGLVTQPNSDLKSTCQTLYSQCSQETLPADAGVNECASAAQQLSGCTATIGQINQCIEDQVNAEKAAFASMNLSCDMATQMAMDAGGLPQQPSITSPNSCSTLPAACAGFVSGNQATGA